MEKNPLILSGKTENTQSIKKRIKFAHDIDPSNILVSFIIPYFKDLSNLIETIKVNFPFYYDSSEVVIVLDEPSEYELLEEFILKRYKEKINFKVIDNKEGHEQHVGFVRQEQAKRIAKMDGESASNLQALLDANRRIDWNPTKAINLGIRNSYGEYVCIMGAQTVLMIPYKNHFYEKMMVLKKGFKDNFFIVPQNSIVLESANGIHKIEHSHAEIFYSFDSDKDEHYKEEQALLHNKLDFDFIICSRKDAEAVNGFEEDNEKWRKGIYKFENKLIKRGVKQINVNKFRIVHCCVEDYDKFNPELDRLRRRIEKQIVRKYREGTFNLKELSETEKDILIIGERERLSKEDVLELERLAYEMEEDETPMLDEADPSRSFLGVINSREDWGASFHNFLYRWDEDKKIEEYKSDNTRYSITERLDNYLRSEKYDDLDVLHLGFFFFQRHSLFKIVDNLVNNSTRTKQNFLSLQDNRIEDVITFINIVKPKILHLHFNDFVDKSVFDKLEYNPFVFATCHSELQHKYKSIIDFMICINELSYDLNEGPRTVIENTVWIDPKMIRKDVKKNKTGCLAVRYEDFTLSKQTIDIYSKLEANVFVYGYLPFGNAFKLRDYMRKYPNLIPMDWQIFAEREIARHSLFTFIKPVVDSTYQYDMNVMEAAALGVPCVTTKKRQEFQQYVINGVTGFQAQNSKDFIEKCNLLFTDHEMYSEFKKNAVENALKLENRMPRQYEELYLMALGK